VAVATWPAENRHRGSGHPLSPAAPPDMRVPTGRFRGLRKAVEQPRKTKRVEVGKRERDQQTASAESNCQIRNPLTGQEGDFRPCSAHSTNTSGLFSPEV
jgi:hypothetical protein